MTDQARNSVESVNRRYVLAILFTIMLVSNLDRYVLAILVQPIKLEMHLSDLQIGLLTGFAFSALYAFSSIPIAHLADRGFRHRVIWISLLLWGACTAACGLAQNFVQMLLARFGVGASESGASPAGQSMLSDLYSPAERNGAMALLQGGGSVGLLLAFSLGGWLESHIGWRATFLVVAAPSAALALLFVLTVPDWQNRSHHHADAGDLPRESFLSVLKNRHFLLLCLSGGLLMLMLTGIPQWLPAFIERSHGLPRANIGGLVAATNGIGMLCGIVGAGWLADRLARRNRVWPPAIMLGSAILVPIPFTTMLLAEGTGLMFAMMAIGGVLIGAPAGILTAMTQNAVLPHQRASAAACFLLSSSLIGVGLGPLLIGGLSDFYLSRAGADSLRWALVTIVLVDCPLLILAWGRVFQFERRRPR